MDRLKKFRLLFLLLVLTIMYFQPNIVSAETIVCPYKNPNKEWQEGQWRIFAGFKNFCYPSNTYEGYSQLVDFTNTHVGRSQLYDLGAWTSCGPPGTHAYVIQRIYGYFDTSPLIGQTVTGAKIETNFRLRPETNGAGATSGYVDFYKANWGGVWYNDDRQWASGETFLFSQDVSSFDWISVDGYNPQYTIDKNLITPGEDFQILVKSNNEELAGEFDVLAPALYVTVAEVTELPPVKITKAKMVSPTELGIAVKVWFPEYLENNRRFVKFNATINEQPIEEIIDITDYIEPGKEVEIGVDINGNLDPDTPLRIDLKQWQVVRFTKNEKFELMAVTYTEYGIQSAPDAKEVEILLPVAIIHGIMAEPGSPLPVWLQRFLNPFLSKPLAYWPLIKYLERETSGDFITGYDIESETASGEKKYRTLWLFTYDSVTGTPEGVAEALEILIDKITSQEEAFNYANKINLIGHSLGGLVGRYYTATYGGSDTIHRLIMVGTPNNGSSRFYTQSSGWSREYIEKILNKMPFLSWFIPTYDALYDNYTDYPYNPLTPFIDNSFPNHPLPANVAYHSIYGIGQKTFRALIVNIKKDWYVVEWKKVRRHWRTLSSPGDMTVPEEGAKLHWEESNMPVNNNLTHALLPADPEVRKTILYECLLQDY